MAGFTVNIEQFRLVDGYNNYEVSSFGRVRNNKTGRILRHRDNGNGYLSLQLGRSSGNKYVHRLVCSAFIPNPEMLLEIDHISRMKNDNNVLNLRWVTRSQNLKNRLCNKTNISGITGVQFKSEGGSWSGSIKHGQTYFGKSFSVSKYGDDQVKALAIDWRKAKEVEFGYLN